MGRVHALEREQRVERPVAEVFDHRRAAVALVLAPGEAG